MSIAFGGSSSQFMKELYIIGRKSISFDTFSIYKETCARVTLRSFVNSKPDAEQILLSIVRNKNEYNRKILKWMLKRKLSG